MLPTIKELQYYPEQHRYRYKGDWLLNNVSSVIGYFIDEASMAFIEKYREGPKGWEKRGKDIHAYTDDFLQKKNPKDLPDWEDWTKAIREQDFFKGSILFATEYALCDEGRSLGGSFDFLLQEQEGRTLLGDLKTCSSLKAAKSRKPATEQLGAYASMIKLHHPEVVIDKCCTVVSGPKLCRVIEQEVDECIEKWEETWLEYDILNNDF